MKIISYITFIFIISLLIFSAIAFAGNNDLVDIFINPMSITLNNNEVNISNILYDNKTYISIRDISQVLGFELQYDQKSKIINLIGKTNNNKQLLLSSILNLFSKALQLSGILILLQIAYSRMKKDLYYIKKFQLSGTTTRRLLYTSSSTRISLYLITLGTILGYFNPICTFSFWIIFILIPIMTALFWFSGLALANSMAKNEKHDIAEN